MCLQHRALGSRPRPAITRLAREGRKYGISLGLITQLASELSPEALSQCGTVFALRLGYYLDHRFIQTALPDAARGMLAALNQRPHRARTSREILLHALIIDALDYDFLDDGIRRWRQQSRNPIRS